MTKKLLCGYVSIFRDKRGGDRLQGVVTKVGSLRFEQARAKLARLASRAPGKVSDGDVIEALARGWADTTAYLTTHKPNG